MQPLESYLSKFDYLIISILQGYLLIVNNRMLPELFIPKVQFDGPGLDQTAVPLHRGSHLPVCHLSIAGGIRVITSRGARPCRLL